MNVRMSVIALRLLAIEQQFDGGATEFVVRECNCGQLRFDP